MRGQEWDIETRCRLRIMDYLLFRLSLPMGVLFLTCEKHETGSIAGVLAQCAALAHLDLSHNRIGAAGAESLAGVQGQCAALTHLNLCGINIGAAGAEGLAGVLPHCTALADLDLYSNQIGAVAVRRLGASWRG
jgi:Ran GTPase-activating protein (RanGAP) involved in mRNA processing and transport